MFRTVPMSIIRSLFTVHSAVVYIIKVCRQLSSRIVWPCSKALLNLNYSINSVSLHSHLSILKISIALNSSLFCFTNQDKTLCCLFVWWERLKCVVLQQVHFIRNITDSFNSRHSHVQGNRLYCYEHYDHRMLQFTLHWFRILVVRIRKLTADAFVVVRKWILFC